MDLQSVKRVWQPQLLKQNNISLPENVRMPRCSLVFPCQGQQTRDTVSAISLWTLFCLCHCWGRWLSSGSIDLAHAQQKSAANLGTLKPGELNNSRLLTLQHGDHARACTSFTYTPAILNMFYNKHIRKWVFSFDCYLFYSTSEI